MTKQAKYTRSTGGRGPRKAAKQNRVVRGVYTPARTSRRPEKYPSMKPGITISKERRVDIFGGVLVLLGIFSILSLFSTASRFAMWWAQALRWLMGWGVILLPLGLIGGGLLLILRRVERIPRFPLEQITGFFLLFLNFLTLLHFLGGGIANPYLLAEEAGGGGYIGASILNFLVEALGGFGSFLVLLAWLLTALILSFDVSLQQVVEMFRGHIKDIKLPVKPSATEIHTYKPAGGVEADGFTPLPDRAATRQEQPQPVNQPVVRRAKQPATQWKLPEIGSVLEYGIPQVENEKLDMERARILEETLALLGAPGNVVEILRGPAVTLFGVEPDFVEMRGGNQIRVRVAKIVSLAGDLALALAATRIRIQAPVPGQNYVGIEVPNETTSIVRLRDVMESPAYKRRKSNLKIPLGKDVSGNPVSSDLTNMPHLLIAGATNSGKSVCVNSILTSLLLTNTPDDLRLVLVDPKRVEMSGYNGIPHLLSPVIVEPDKVVGVLQWMTREMENRFHKFVAAGVRNLEEYNGRVESRGEKKLPIILIVIDEMSDLMIRAQNETEAAIARLAQMARATGLHLIIATQRPSTEVITGKIKANFPARIAFMVASNTDSRVILDQPGAEDLLGRGDMLFQAPDAAAPVRLQGTYVADEEIQKVVDHWKKAGASSETPHEIPLETTGAAEPVTRPAPAVQEPEQDLFVEFTTEKEPEDPMTATAIDLVRREGRASISQLQKRMSIGYTRAARLIDYMEEKGIISPPLPNTQAREVLDYGPTAPPEDDGA